MKRIFTSVFLSILSIFFLSNVNAASSKNAKGLVQESLQKSSVNESIKYIENNLSSLTAPAEKRSAYAFLGSVQEQMGLFSQAEKSYAAAAAISAADADEMPKKSSEQLVIDAVRCALSLGDYNSAESYLKSAVKDSKNEKIIAYVKLYTLWAKLCRAESEDDILPVVEALKAFVGLDCMKDVEPSVLLTLYHLTGEKSYSLSLKKKYPSSMEYAVVNGDVQQLPLPFWYFVPRSTDNFFDSLPENQDSKPVKKGAQKKNDGNQDSESRKALRQQLGLFKVEKNAKKMVEKLKNCGFNARIITDIRSDKVTYYSVVVDENKNGTMGKALNDAGFACSPVME